MKFFGSTESKITKDKNGKNVPHLEIVELELFHCNLVGNDYQQNSFVLKKHLEFIRYFTHKSYLFKNI